MIAAADEMDDLQLVAVLDQHVRQRRARHDLQIALDRQLLGDQPQLVGERGDASARATTRLCSPLTVIETVPSLWVMRLNSVRPERSRGTWPR